PWIRIRRPCNCATAIVVTDDDARALPGGNMTKSERSCAECRIPGTAFGRQEATITLSRARRTLRARRDPGGNAIPRNGRKGPCATRDGCAEALQHPGEHGDCGGDHGANRWREIEPHLDA